MVICGVWNTPEARLDYRYLTSQAMQYRVEASYNTCHSAGIYESYI